jgi:hypothetical protein
VGNTILLASVAIAGSALREGAPGEPIDAGIAVTLLLRLECELLVGGVAFDGVAAKRGEVVLAALGRISWVSKDPRGALRSSRHPGRRLPPTSPVHVNA